MGTRPGQRAVDWTDRLGSLASVACVVHCVAPVAASSFLPAAWLAGAAGHAQEGLLLGVALVLALPALALGFQAHRSPMIVATFALGAALLAAGVLAHDHAGGSGIALATMGGLTLAAAHLGNLRQRRMCSSTASVA